MKVKKYLIISFFFILVSQIFADNDLYFLKIKTPSEAQVKKRILPVDLKCIKEITGQIDLKDKKAFIELTKKNEFPIAQLGKTKKGQIKWSHKIVDNKFLLVKFNKLQFPEILNKVKEKSANPGYKILVSELMVHVAKNIKHRDLDGKYFDKKKKILLSAELTFSEFQDLSVKMKYPIGISHQEDLKDKISITVKNNGTTASASCTIDLVLSKESKIPQQNLVYAKNFSEGSVVKLASKEIQPIKRGEELTFNFENSIQIPEEIPLGNFYLGTISDPENKGKELFKQNNIDVGLIMISAPEVKNFACVMNDTKLIFEPATFNLKIISHGAIISDGKDWRKCAMRPYIYHLLYMGWKDFFWEVNTQDSSVWVIKKGKFCKTGGSAREIKLKVSVVGGSQTTKPSKVTLNLSNTKMTYECATRRFEILAYDNQIAYLPFWKACQFKPHLFHFKYTLWEDFFWEVDTFKKQVNHVSGTGICKKKGIRKALSIQVKTEK